MKKTTSLPQRRSLRLSGYDYSRAGAYFVTLCVEKRSSLFGEVVGGEIRLNDAGRMIEQIWLELPQHYPGIKVDICRIMPDHFHGIIWLEPQNCQREPTGGLPYAKSIRTPPKDGSSCPSESTQNPYAPPVGTGCCARPNRLSDIVQRFKSLTTHLYIKGVSKEGWQKFPGRLWQRSYFDHVIRNEQDLEDTRKYIVNNPRKWQQNHETRTQVSDTAGMKPVKSAESGFTLVEMVVVIVIVGILAALGGQFVVAPVTGYVDLARRTRLVDQAEMALRRMQRDIRHALPNSIRIGGGGRYLEMLNTVDGGRYRRYPDPTTGGDILDFDSADSGFDVLGPLSRLPVTGDRLVVYNISTTGSTGNAFAPVPDNMAVIGTGSTPMHINLNPSFDFANTSPNQRFFIVDQPVSYGCEGAVLNRYDGYGIVEDQPLPPGGTPALVTRGVSSCSFSYDPGVSQRAGLVTLEISLSEEGETITLLHQVHVVNAP